MLSAVVSLEAQVPQILNYQGRVAVGNPAINFHGTGSFKFALVQGTGPTLLWKNDGSSGNTEPAAAVTLTVTKGLYSVLLGDTGIANMTAIPPGVFANSDVRLRVWFDDGTNGVQQLTPDHRIAAVGYAIMVGSVADGAVASAKIAAGAVGSSQLANNLTLPGTTTGTFSGSISGNATTATTAGSAISFTGALGGDVTGTQGATTIAATTVTGKALTGFSSTTGAITGSDTILSAINKLNGNLALRAPLASPTFTGIVTAPGFSGSGAGLSNIPQTAVAAPPPGMVLIPAGTYMIGRTSGDTDSNAVPVSVTVSSFYMDVNEVTFSQWRSVSLWATANGYSVNAGSGKGPNHPVQSVSWYDALKWCNARSEQAGRTPVYYTNDAQTTVYKTGNVDVTNIQVKLTANGYRLPTEAEWEWAGRGGRSGLRFPWGDTTSQDLANYTSNLPTYSYDLGPVGLNGTGSVGGTAPATSPVGTFAANGYGLHDMIGNVLEWCWDWFGTPYPGGTNPQGPVSGSFRVIRGGSWESTPQFTRVSNRSVVGPSWTGGNNVGFRAVLSVGP